MASSGVEKRSPANLVTGLESLEAIAPFERQRLKQKESVSRD